MKFKVGEIVVVAITRDVPTALPKGTEVEIIAVRRGIGEYGLPFDYLVDSPFGRRVCAEYQLRKRRPPEEPGSWEEIEKLTNWNPTRVTA